MMDFSPIQMDELLDDGDAGVELGQRVVVLLKEGDGQVALSFEGVRYMSPTYVNAFVMTVVHEVGVDMFRSRVETVNASERNVDAIERSVVRYEKGIRLSHQDPAEG